MFSVDDVAGRSSGSPLWVEVVVVALVGGVAVYLVGRLIDVLALCLDQHRHPALPGPSV
jgi:hypothetical protein